ncbi:MAG: DUF4190 domain-containing protein, partial [Planctomycetota bacterium]
SGWALGALLCSLALACPPLTLVAPVLGLRALHDIRARGDRRGRGLAQAAIVIGTLATAGWVAALLWWHVTVRRPLLDGPAEALATGLAGDVSGFHAAFDGTGAATEAEAGVFLGELSARYGRLAGMDQRRVEDLDGLPARPPGGAVVPYVLAFETGTVEAEAAFRLRDEASGRFVFRWAWIAVRDAEAGDLVYPASYEEAARRPPEQVNDAGPIVHP